MHALKLNQAYLIHTFDGTNRRMSKNSKSPNFTALEKTVLLELIDSRKDVIENKQNDGKMVLKKNSEWEKITTEFNASHGVHQRTCIQLKSLWKNMKSRTKTAVARDRREKAKTGGGPQADTELDSLHTAISTMLPQQINSIGNEFDDDAALHGDLDKNPSPNKEVRYTNEKMSVDVYYVNYIINIMYDIYFEILFFLDDNKVIVLVN